MRIPEIVRMLRATDVLFIQESWLRGDRITGGQKLLKTHNVFSCSRGDRRDVRNPRGGVLAIVKSHLNVSVLEHLSSPNVMVLDLGELVAVNVYVPPKAAGNEPDDQGDDTAVMERAEQAIRAANDIGKPLVVVGDWNGRIGNLTASPSDPKRRATDTVGNDRGSDMLRIARENDLVVLNGAIGFDRLFGRLTSHQATGTSTIDYILASSPLLPAIRDFRVDLRSPHSDHSCLAVTIKLDTPLRRHSRPSRKRKRHTSPQPPNSPSPDAHDTRDLDRMLEAIVNNLVDPESASQVLFGKIVHAPPTRRDLWIATSHSSWALYAGFNSRLNTTGPILASEPTYTPLLCALQAALAASDPYVPLSIHCNDKSLPDFVLRQLPYYAAIGYRCPTGALMSDVCRRIQARACTLTFCVAPDSSPHANAARHLAEMPPHLQPRAPLDSLAPKRSGTLPPPCTPAEPRGPKVTVFDAAAINPDDVRRNAPWHRTGFASWSQDPSLPDWNARTNHRGRQTAADVQREQRDRLAAASSLAEKWRLIRKWTTPVRKQVQVPIDDLTRDFQSRMNDPKGEDATHIDPLRLRLMELRAALIPERTGLASSPSPCFSRPISVEEVDAMKVKVKAKGAGAASGADRLSYKCLLDVPSDVLVDLFNSCIVQSQIPTAWLRSILVAILKPGRDATLPSSYRIIALESCFLKMLTLIVDVRLREWAESLHIIPESQNGFRPHRRVENNLLILRAAVEQSAADGKPLYTVFVDLTNAFPSVNRAALWVKMHRSGASGPIFDWLRALYARMDYSVFSGGSHSNAFRSSMGILAGDPASPIAFLLYLADFVIPPHDSDVPLADAAVSHAEQADDMLLLARSFQGAQYKLNMVHSWTVANFMQANPAKSAWMRFGSDRTIPSTLPLTLNGATVPRVSSYKYLGVTVSTPGPHIFRKTFQISANKAVKKGNQFLGGIKDEVGHIPPFLQIALYHAIIDPTLCYMSPVIVDLASCHLATLDKVQHTFLRRILSVGQSTYVPFLHSETGIWPIRHRRMWLTLGYLDYLRILPASSYARAAALSSSNLADEGVSASWYAVIRSSLAALNVHDPLPPLQMLTADVTLQLRRSLRRELAKTIDRWLADSPKSYLLPHIASPPVRKSFKNSLAPRAYLRIQNPVHRHALTGILVSNHGFAIEALRAKGIPRHERLCRACAVTVETPEHAMLECLFVPTRLRTLRDCLMEVDGETLPQRIARLLQDEYTAGMVAQLAYETVIFWKTFD